MAANSRPDAGLIHVSFDARDAVKLANLSKAQSEKIPLAATLAHDKLARLLTEDIAKRLEQKVAARGRVQGAIRGRSTGKKSKDDRLANVIRSKQNRRVSRDGYTVGYLDAVQSVKWYYRGLEEGTDVHVGRFLSGVFSGPKGGRKVTKRGRPILTAGGVDAKFVQTRPWRTEGAYFPGVKIKHAIQGYNYWEGGVREFLGRGGSTDLARSVYVDALAHHGLTVMARALSRNVLPGLSGVGGITPKK